MTQRSWDREGSNKKITSRQKSMARQEARATGKHSDPMKFARRNRRNPEDDEF